MTDDDPPEPNIIQFISQVVHFVLADNKRLNVDCSIMCVNENTIQEYNTQYRKQSYATDVLSFQFEDTSALDFPSSPTPESCNTYLGDVLICREIISLHAKEYSISFMEELTRVVIHGILHLLGFMHSTNESHEPMLVYQEQLLHTFLHKKYKGDYIEDI